MAAKTKKHVYYVIRDDELGEALRLLRLYSAPPETVGVLESIIKSRTAYDALVDAAKEFVHRCDVGEVRSHYTYAKFKDILAAIEVKG